MQNVFWNIYDLETRLGDIYGTRRDGTIFFIFMILNQNLVILMAQGETQASNIVDYTMSRA